MPNGFTLPELLSVVAIAGVLASVVVPPANRALDRAAVREGAERFAALHAATRQAAISRATLARLELDSVRRTGTVSVRRTPSAWDTVAVGALGSARLAFTNGTLVFGPLGMGYGTSNSTVVFIRGTAADTVTTSRTGRLRR